MATWRILWSSTFLLLAFLSFTCDGIPISRAEKTELEETLDKMNALLDKLADSLDEESDPKPQFPIHPPSKSQEEPEPDQPKVEEGKWEQEERSWDDGPEPEIAPDLEPRDHDEDDASNKDNMSLREAVKYLMLLQKQKHDQQPAVKRDHDIPFPFMDTGHRNRWSH